MELHIRVLGARDLPSSKKSLYVKVKVGSEESRTREVANSDPSWREEFVFGVEGNEEGEIALEVFCEGDELLGKVCVSVRSIFDFDEAAQSVAPTWFALQPGCGKILLSISSYGRNDNSASYPAAFSSLSPCARVDQLAEPVDDVPLVGKGSCNRIRTTNSMSAAEETKPAEVLSSHEEKEFIRNNEANLIPKSHDPSELSATLFTNKNDNTGTYSSSNFEEIVGTIQSNDGTEMPENLPGGILLEQTYRIEPKDMNTFLFGPNSQFNRDLAERQGIMDYQAGSWTWKCKDIKRLTRLVTYTKPSAKIVKAVKAIEEQSYLKADGKSFVVLSRVSTPDVPYGSCFQVMLLYKILPGPQLSSGEDCCHLVISWNIEFSQSTIMKSIIEGTAQQGIKESYVTFADLLAQYIRPVNSSELVLDKDRLLAHLKVEHQSHWDLAVKYLCNFTVISTFFMFLLVLLHILLSRSVPVRGLEFNGLDLPDTFGELITCGILVLQAERAFIMVSHFIKARLQRGSDHGIKAQGDGWVVTVALIEGSNLPVFSSSGFSDPYVVFSCNGQTRTSSVKLQTRDPQWNEILEFDAMQEPPSVLNVQFFHFDGPFDVAIPIAQSEINFVKHSSEELADMWVLLDGKLGETSQDSKLHLRIFVDNTKGAEAIREYLRRMEREVGKKFRIRSPHKNATFQKLFGLPPEEFLIDDFSCALKRRMPLQGRLFLSARIVGFYANIFGHKTKFFFLWEDIEDIEEVAPSFSTLGSPALLMILRSGRCHDARHGAKSQDEEGRLRFQFQSFGSFNVANRTIMALWRTRTLSCEQHAKLEEDYVSELEDDHLDQSGKSGEDEDSESLFDNDGTKLSKAFSAKLSINVELLMQQIFGGGQLEKRVMEKVGCLNYSATQWEAVGPDRILERHVRYKFNRHMSIFGGDVCSIQQKTPTLDWNGWIVDEVMTLHSVPFADHFHIRMKHRVIEMIISNSVVSQCDVFVGIAWLKKSKFKKRITRNICDKLTNRSKDIFELAEREIISSGQLQDQVTDETQCSP